MSGTARLAAVALVVGIVLACTPAEPSPSAAPTPVGTSPSGSPAAVSPSAEPSEVPIDAAQWERLEATGPEARARHSWTVDASGTIAYLFGGLGTASALGDLWAYDMSADAWVPLAPAGDGPSARSGHVASWIDGLGLVVFGGTGDGRVLGDLWAYDPEADAWRTVDVEGAAPDARTGACAGLGPDGRWWLVGGQDASGARLADLWALDPGGARWTPVPVDRDGPSGRDGATCWWTGDGRLVVSGGMTDDETVVGDRWLLEGVSEGRPRWTRDAVEAVPRALSAAALSASDMVISGGVGPDGAPSDDLVAVDARTLASRAIPPAGAHPSARSGAASVDDPGGERTLLFGGVDEVGPSAEVWALALP